MIHSTPQQHICCRHPRQQWQVMTISLVIGKHRSPYPPLCYPHDVLPMAIPFATITTTTRFRTMNGRRMKTKVAFLLRILVVSIGHHPNHSKTTTTTTIITRKCRLFLLYPRTRLYRDAIRCIPSMMITTTARIEEFSPIARSPRSECRWPRSSSSNNNNKP